MISRDFFSVANIWEIQSHLIWNLTVNFAGSSLIFPGRDGAPFTNQAFNARIKLACERARVPVISAHPLRTTCNGVA